MGGGASGGSTGGGSPLPDGGVPCGTDGGVCFCYADGGVVGGWTGLNNPCICPTDGGPAWARAGEGCLCTSSFATACDGNRLATCLLTPSPYMLRWVITTCPMTCGVVTPDGGFGCQ